MVAKRLKQNFLVFYNELMTMKGLFRMLMFAYIFGLLIMSINGMETII